MTGTRLVSTILRGAWLIDPRFAQGYLGKVIKVLSGEPVSFYSDDEIKQNTEKHKPYAMALGADSTMVRYTSYDAAPTGSVAVLNYSGVVMKEDSCGIPGTATMRKLTLEAYNHPNIGAIFIKMDSGGGSVDGTFEWADVVSSNKKPVIAFVDGLAASAGYAIISGASKIFASHDTAEIGSIGTASTLYDQRGALEQMGYKMHYINADTSPDKNQDYFKAIENDYSSIKKNILNPTNAIFQAMVKKNRSGVLTLDENNEPLTGKVYLAKAAVNMGLIDEIKSEEEALSYAQKQATKNNTMQQSSQNKMNVKLTSALSAIAKFFGYETKEGTEQEVELTQENLEALNAKLELLSGLENQVATLNADKVTLNSTIESLNSTIVELKAEVAALKTPAQAPVHAVGDPSSEIKKPAAAAAPKSEDEQLKDINAFNFATASVTDDEVKEFTNAGFKTVE